MAGHSKWANIKHRKGLQDKRRGRLFTKLIKELYISVRENGPDPEANPRLRMAIKNARKAGVTRDTIEKAMKKGSAADGDDYEEFTVEGYAAHGVAIFIECMSDNLNRTLPNIRLAFSKHGGALGKNGSVGYMFDRKGVFMFPEEGFDEDTLMMELLEYGLEDIQREEGSFILTCAFEDYGPLNTRLESLNIEAESSLQRIPANQVALDIERARTVLRLLEILEEDDDIQNIFHNLEMTEEIAEAMSGN